MAVRYCDPRAVIDVARDEIGYIEKKSAKDLDDKTANAGDKNYTKYARDLDALGWFNGRKQGICGWCSIFVCYCFMKAYGTEEALRLLCQHKGAGNCAAHPYYGSVYFKAKKQLITAGRPQPGDQIFFLPADGGEKPSHTGLVVDVDAQYVYCIEGNTNGGSGHGGCVAEKKYALNNKRIYGYGRPDWGEMPVDEPEDGDTADGAIEDEGIVLYDGPDGDYEMIGEVSEVQEIVALAATGWIGVEYKGRIAWIDPEDVKIVARGSEDV